MSEMLAFIVHIEVGRLKLTYLEFQLRIGHLFLVIFTETDL